MNAIVLDSSVIIRYPKILSLKIPDTDIFTTTDILSEIGYNENVVLNGNQKNAGLFELIQIAISEKTLIIQPLPPTVEKVSADTKIDYSLSISDYNLIRVAAYISRAYKTITIATLDRRLQKALSNYYSIGFFSATQIENLIGKNKGTKNSLVEEKTTQYESKVNRTFIRGIFIGVLVTVLVISLYFNFKTIIETINIWGTITLAIMLGIGLFVFREKQKFSYGVFEFLSGISTIIIVFYPSFNYSNITYSFDFYAKLLGGLYIMVRGEDNIIRSLQGKKWGLWIKQKTGIG